MLHSYLVAVGVMVVLTSAWLTVQLARRRAFPEATVDEDLLGARDGCGTCPRSVDCEPTRGH